MQRKKGIYDLVYYKTKEVPEKLITGVDWKNILNHLSTDYKEFMNVKDQEHTTEPFFKIVTSIKSPDHAKEKNKEEYFYTKRK